MLTPSGADGLCTWRKKRGRLLCEKQICMWSSTKPGRQKIPTFCFVTLGRRLSTTVAPLSAYPWIVVFHLTLNLSLSWVSPFTFELTSLSYIAMRIKRYWWVNDGNKRNLMRNFWELDGNKRILFETWWEQRNLIKTWWEQGILMGYWWEQEEFDKNYLGTKGFWWDISGNKRNSMGSVWELDGASPTH